MTSDTTPVLLLPGAGSYGGELAVLAEACGPNARVARYPGRFGPDFGRSTSLAEVVGVCADQAQTLASGAVVLIGHSLGAYVAHATAAELASRGDPPRALVVVGADAPHRMRVPASAVRDEAGMAAYLENADPGMLPDPADEWYEVVVETALRDMALLTEYTALSPPAPSCPVYAARGEDDPLTTLAGIGEWPRVGGVEPRLQAFPGSHSDLLTTSAFTEWVCGLVGSA